MAEEAGKEIYDQFQNVVEKIIDLRL